MVSAHSFSTTNRTSWCLGAGLGLLLDRGLPEPGNRHHPVALLGRSLTRLEARSYRDTRRAGLAHLAVAVAATGAIGSALQRLVGPFAATAATVTVATGSTMLTDTAVEIAQSLEAGDLEAARRQVRALVGRDPSSLDTDEIVRAVIESVAENTVDAATATLAAAQLAGPVGVVVHRTVNTLDAMIGHRSARYQRFGWASARFDDLLNWLPARLTAVAVAVLHPRRAVEILTVVRRDGAKHPSPNGGVVEAAFAAALEITVGGANDYGGVVEIRGPQGDGPPPSIAQIDDAVRLSRRVSTLLATAPLMLLGLKRLAAVVPPSSR